MAVFSVNALDRSACIALNGCVLLLLKDNPYFIFTAECNDAWENKPMRGWNKEYDALKWYDFFMINNWISDI